MQDAPKVERFSNAEFHLHSCSLQFFPRIGLELLRPKTLALLWIFLFPHLATPQSSKNPLGSTFRMYLELNYFSPAPPTTTLSLDNYRGLQAGLFASTFASLQSTCHTAAGGPSKV